MSDPQAKSTGPISPHDPGPCPACHAPLAADQHYCLSCGARQQGSRVPVTGRLTRSVTGGGLDASPRAAGVLEASQPPARDWTPAIALGGLAVLALMLVAGVLIGRGGTKTGKQAAAQVITIGGGGAAATGPTAASVTSISDDWPAGHSGYTVQLKTVPKAGATAVSVSAAKSAASGKGAPGVGVLDAANYKSLGRKYIVYSGDYPTARNAKAALGKLKRSFSGAKVIHVVPSAGATGNLKTTGNFKTTASGAVAGGGAPVSAAQAQQSAGALKSLNSCSGAACSKKARTITNPVAVGGAPPPPDNKAPGAGSAPQTIN